MECSQLDRLDKRRLAFKEAAHALFLEQGYDRTTLADVVDRAGGSLATLYKLFGNKEGLLDAVVSDARDLGEEPINRIAALDISPAEKLHSIGCELSRIYLSPDNLTITRMVIARSICDPEFARAFFDLSQMRTKNAMHALFRDWHQSGISMLGDPDTLAELFLGLLVHDFQIQAISHGFINRPSPESLRDRTNFFIRGAGLDS